MENPFELFNESYKKELEYSKLRIPSACCFSTIGEDGYPNSRFVSLKEVKNESFIITGPLNSRKGNDIKNNPKVSITFWWTETKKQVRIQGDAIKLSEIDSKNYFSKRNHESKIVSTIFEQGKQIDTFNELTVRFNEGKVKFKNIDIEKPLQWSGFQIKPKRIEFMDFMETRLHKRTLFIKKEEKWDKFYIQP